MSRIRYQLQIYQRGVVATSGSVSYTYLTSQFAAAPMVAGQVIRPADAFVESSPWSVELLDVAGTAVTGNLASTAGRMHLLGRVARLRASYDSTASTAFQTLSVSRITDVALGGDVTSYRLTLQDERWVERQTDIFTKSNTCMLIPSGIISAFGGVPATPPVSWRVRVVTGNLVCLEYMGVLQQTSGTIPITQSAAQLIADDVIPGAVSGNTGVTTGNFTHLRFLRTTTSVSYEVSTFATILNSNISPAKPGHEPVPEAFTAGFVPRPLYVWLVWSASQPSVNTTVTGYLHMPTHPPTQDLPLHIGGSSGIHPLSLWETLYSGAYSGSTALPVRRSTAAFANLKKEQSYGRLWLRITSPENMATFIEDHLAKPYHVAPVVDSSGRMAPISLRLPATTAITPATLLTLGSSNSISHPTWEHPSNEAITALRFKFHTLRPRGTPLAMDSWITNSDIRLPVDGIQVFDGDTERTADTVTQLGRRVQDVEFPGAIAQPTPGFFFPSSFYVGDLADHLAQHIFPRLQDGPIWSSIDCMDSVDRTTRGRVLPGQFVKVTVATQPNPEANTRGSVRIMQVMARDQRPDGPSFRLLDAGPNLATLLAPTITLALSSQSSRHAVKATIGSIPAGAMYQAQFAITSTGTTAAPASTSLAWFPVHASSRSTASTVFVRGSLPSKRKVWPRVRAVKAQRIGSAWANGAAVVTASIAAPTLSTMQAITAGTARVRWANGSSAYPVRIMVDASTSATLGSSNMIARVNALTTRFDLAGLNSNDSHKIGVQHYDAFGGVSAQDTTTFTTTTGFTALQAPKGLVVVRGA